ncbi:alpha/beta hydrolase domain-containing protein [Streptomonospora salina]|uniref:alpha/beta hydrolase domain-containing protein n=1 Tax=Streptomonospora salina TaxID=104205 RepID=UPI0028A7D378|nr:alpha/beta hydrolase domain-containing protein [Streptomonospora salina]
MLVLVSASAAASPAAAEAAPSPVPVPQVDGPVPGAPPGDPESGDLENTYPYFASTENLDAYGYVEEEFFVSGTAGVYEDGETVSEHPYTTRIVVRRPERERRSNGTALMEWQNVSAGHDLDALWAPSAGHIMRSGYTWVGVSAQDVGVSHLKEWSPTRYGGLDVTDGGAVDDDRLSYDVFSQAAQAVRTGEAGVTGGVGVDTVLAIGASQSAGRMTAYYDRVLPHIEPVFDGYGFMVGTAPQGDRPEPVFQVNSETDAAWNPAPHEDSDTFRLWEVAGAAHSGWAGREARAEVEERDLGGQADVDCTEPPFSRVPLEHALNASYDHLDAWARSGTPPPTAPRLTRTDRGRLARGDDGLALGGVRLSQIAAPTALNTGINTPAGGTETDGFCVLFGTHVPYSEDELAELYPTRGSYIRSVVETDDGNVRDGYITRRDAAANRHDALWSGIGG